MTVEKSQSVKVKILNHTISNIIEIPGEFVYAKKHNDEVRIETTIICCNFDVCSIKEIHF